MVIGLLYLLLYIALLALVFYAVMWFLEYIGVALPEQIRRILWAIFVIIVLILIVRFVVAQNVIPPL